MRKVKCERAQRLLSEVDAHLLLRAAKSGRDRLLLQVAYYGALRVSELARLTWGQVLPRETGEVQLAIVGKGDRSSLGLASGAFWRQSCSVSAATSRPTTATQRDGAGDSHEQRVHERLGQRRSG
jgi:site-specific recombinase XerC